MTPELWQRLKPLFYAALDRDIADRAAFIIEACGNDAELKENLERLVQAAQEDNGTLDMPFVSSFRAADARFSSGEVILGRFRIVRPIDRGGMGEVYEAEDLQLGRVALKTIRSDIASSSHAFNRFRKEVQLARKVSGPQICRIHELYLLPESGDHPATAFLTMEYLDGVTLSERLKRDGSLPSKEALRIALDICAGLSIVHGEGVIHRDLKSANIMLCGQGSSFRAVLMDFGLAHDFRSADSSTHSPADTERSDRTLAGTIMGTPAYMAPEQFEGKPISAAADLYALGVVLYELVTGIHPYAAPTPVAAAIRRAQHPASPSSLNRTIPRKWDRVIQRCLQYEPKDRFQSAEDVAKALRSGPANLNNLRQDQPWLFRTACAFLLAVVAWGCFRWWQTAQYYHPGKEALRWYNAGVLSLKEGNYVKATRSFQAAIDQDKQFVMAHARLAEAWYDLDFVGNAQQELLIALPERSRLPSMEGFYLDAIQATVTGDPSGAIRKYGEILDHLEPSDQSHGEVDLGVAYERSGDIPHALEHYARAAAEDRNNPSAFMHTGILQGRLHHVADGNKAFDRAQSIFTTEINAEGLAELDYERGYAANTRGESKDAVPFLKRSLDEAASIPSVQLEIRALSQLSSAESVLSHDSQAVADAERAIGLAHDNQLGPWAANGLVRLANVQLAQGHLKEAEQPLQEAMQILHQSPQPRVQALANSTFASLMEQEHHPEKVEEAAQAALEYYQKNGFSEGARSVAILMVRVHRNKGQLNKALESGNVLLSLVYQSGLPIFITQAEEVVGTVYLSLEQYPEALSHFQKAEQLAPTDLLKAYQAFDCGTALWKLGRYPESEAMLGRASQEPALLPSVGESRVESFLSQTRYGPALKLAQQLIAKYPDMEEDRKRDLWQDETIAEGHLNMKREARAGLSTYFSPDEFESPADVAQRKLNASEVYLWTGMYREAYDAAAAAHDTLVQTGQHQSELRSACLAAAASKTLKDDASFNRFSNKALDILREVKQNWGPVAFQKYIQRPDMDLLIHRLSTRPE